MTPGATTRPAGSETGQPPAPFPGHGPSLRSWRALGTYVHLQVDDPDTLDRAAARAQAVLGEVDLACSRFRIDSDLSDVNSRAGRWTPVSPVLVGALRVALEAAAVTGGLVDPTLGRQLAAAGYDRTFALVPAASATATEVPAPVRPNAWREVIARTDEVFIPSDVRLDLGATGKAYAADLVAATLVEELGISLVISVGGDVRVGGPVRHTPAGPARPQAWPVAIGHTIEEVGRGEIGDLVLLRDGGLATSSSAARRWVRNGRDWHHLIDPRTGVPTTGPWRTVSALGHTCAAANTASTAAMILGERAPQWLTEHGVAARLVGPDDEVVTTAGWPDHDETADPAHDEATAGTAQPGRATTARLR